MSRVPDQTIEDLAKLIWWFYGDTLLEGRTEFRKICWDVFLMQSQEVAIGMEKRCYLGNQ